MLHQGFFSLPKAWLAQAAWHSCSHAGSGRAACSGQGLHKDEEHCALSYSFWLVMGMLLCEPA